MGWVLFRPFRSTQGYHFVTHPAVFRPTTDDRDDRDEPLVDNVDSAFGTSKVS